MFLWFISQKERDIMFGIHLESDFILLLLSRLNRVQLCDPIDSSPPGSLVPGILQARTLQWVAISFSIAWKWTGKVKLLSRVRLLVTPWTAARQAPPSMGFSRQEYWSGVPLPSPFVSLGKFIPRYLIIFVVMVNGLDSLISLSYFSLLVYRNVWFLCIDFVSYNFAKFTD